MSRAAAERLETETGGNPLYLRALLQEVDPQVLVDTRSPLPAPRVFANGVILRLAHCSGAARCLVEAASVLGQRCSLS